MYGHGYGDFMDGAFGALAAFGIMAFMIFAVAVALYVIQALGLYKMAKNRGEQYAWFAWVPFLSLILIGNMVGPFKLGKYDIKNPGLFMAVLGLSILNVELIGAAIMMMFIPIPLLNILVGFVMGIVLFAYPILVAVFEYLLFFKFFKQYDPEKATMYLVLTIFFSSIALAVFYFTYKDKMPVASEESGPGRLQ